MLQIRHILEKPTAGGMQFALENLPPNLDSYYQRTMQRIAKMPSSRRTLGMNTLLWLTYALAPATFAGLSEALTTPFSSTSINVSYGPSKQVIFQCTMGLAAIDDDIGLVRLVHHSVYEYLDEKNYDIFPDA